MTPQTPPTTPIEFQQTVDLQKTRGISMHNSRTREIVVSAILVPLALLWIYPFVWMVSAALKTNNEVFGSLSLIPKDLQWENFQRAWVDARVGDYFLNTIIVTASTVTIVVVTTAMMGYALGRYDFPGRKFIIGLFLSTVFIPEGYTIIPIFELLTRLRISDSLFGIILAQSGAGHVIIILLFMGYFAQLPKELEEAAVLDGASFLRVFWQVMLPLTRPIIATAIIMQFMYSWNDFLLPLVVTLARPELRTLAVGVYSFQGENFTDWTGMAAAATISLVPIIIVFIFLQRYFIEGLAGAVKA